MATTGIVNGHYLRLYCDGTAVAKATSCEISWSTDLRETAHKDTPGDGVSGWREVAAGMKSGTCSTTGLYAEETNSFATLWSAYSAGDTIACQFKTGVSGDTVWYGNGIITSLSLSAPNNENVEYTINIDFTGECIMS